MVDVTTVHLSDDFVESKCKIVLKGQKATLLIGGCKCAVPGELDESMEAVQFAFK